MADPGRTRTANFATGDSLKSAGSQALAAQLARRPDLALTLVRSWGCDKADLSAARNFRTLSLTATTDALGASGIVISRASGQVLRRQMMWLKTQGGGHFLPVPDPNNCAEVLTLLMRATSLALISQAWQEGERVLSWRRASHPQATARPFDSSDPDAHCNNPGTRCYAPFTSARC